MSYFSKQMAFFTILLLIIIGLIFFSGSIISKDTEKQEFKILKKIESYGIEIRQYPKMALIQTQCDTENNESKKVSFKLLANYIFGGNDQKMKIAMTAPVIQKINKDDEECTMNFIVPKKYKIEDLPNPLSDKISIIEESEKVYISITFSGNNTESNRKKYKEILLQYCKDHSIKINENPLILSYNPPWTLPFLKKNDILFEILDEKF